MGGLGLLGPGLEAGRFESPLSWNSKLDLGFLGPCGRVNLFPSSAHRSCRLDLSEKGYVWRRPTVLRQVVESSVMKPSLFSTCSSLESLVKEDSSTLALRHWKCSRTDPRSQVEKEAQSASSNPSYPSDITAGVGPEITSRTWVSKFPTD